MQKWEPSLEANFHLEEQLTGKSPSYQSQNHAVDVQKKGWKMNNCSSQESNSVKCDIFSASLKGICSYFPSIGETSGIAVGDENLLRQKKANPSEVPAAVIPRLRLIWHHSSQDSVYPSFPFVSLHSVSLYSTLSWSNCQIITATTWRS